MRRPGRVAVVGAGCAGLSLACALVERWQDVDLAVHDARSEFGYDRTWCGWTFEDSAWSELVERRWPAWSVRAGGRTVRVTCPDHPYRLIRSDRFYAAARARLESAPGVTLALGTPVRDVRREASGPVVETASGNEAYDHVFDGRPVAAEPEPVDRPRLWQHFEGLVVEMEAATFPEDTVTLMDFDVDQKEGLHFMYVLPLSDRRALVEATFMTPEPPTELSYESRITTYLRARWYRPRFRTLHREAGCIPMDGRCYARRPAPGIWRIGTAGGVVKPSTGYAFDAIQRDTARMVEAYESGAAEPPPVRSSAVWRLDRIFLGFLARHPEAGPLLFRDMFARVTPERLVRFLCERATWRDRLAVMRAMPRLRFARHAAETWREWV